jgi:ectoine hydroxylase-related dioxygenase (phytanoyl-CoA dioxygenase family)
MSSLTTAPQHDLSSQISENGFAILNNVFDAECDALADALENLPADEKVRRRDGVYGVRDLFALVPAIAELARAQQIRSMVSPILGEKYYAVRSIFFDKPVGANWMVPWHQDLTIAVKSRIDSVGYGPWSVKAGIAHVQPPAPLLASMLTVRIHLDDCSVTNGALEVLPGSHLCGRLSAEAIRGLRANQSPVSCEVKRGGCLLMRPLLVHASKPSQTPNHRRVIHIEFAASKLSDGLEWYEQV